MGCDLRHSHSDMVWACAFITDWLYRYLKEHGGEEPVGLVLHAAHKRALREELPVPRAGVQFDGREFNGMPVLEGPCWRSSWLAGEGGQRWEL